MGLEIELQDEWGGRLDTIADPKNFLGRLLPQNDDPLHPILAAIDSYGDTVFNRMQMPRFLSEWSAISAKVQSREEQELISKIAVMAQRVRDEVGLYLKFVGD